MLPEPPRRPDLRADGTPIGADVAVGSDVASLPDGRPKVTWRFLPLLGVVLLGFLLGSLAAAPFYAIFGDTSDRGASGFSELVQGIVVDLVLVATLVVWLRRWHPGWQRALRLVPGSRVGREVAIGAGLGIVVRIVAGIVAFLLVLLFQTFTAEEVALPEQVTTGLQGAQLVVFVLFAVVVAPISEEFLFRGLVYRSIRDRHGPMAGMLISAALFGSIHLVPGSWIDQLVLQLTMAVTGFGLAWIYERRTTLLAPIAGHAAFNLIAAVVIVGDALR